MKPPKIEYSPGCFDTFDGSQEELDELVKSIENYVSSEELEELLEQISQELDIDLDSTKVKILYMDESQIENFDHEDFDSSILINDTSRILQ